MNWADKIWNFIFFWMCTLKFDFLVIQTNKENGIISYLVTNDSKIAVKFMAENRCDKEGNRYKYIFEDLRKNETDS